MATAVRLWLARLLSVIGHPALLVPAAVAASTRWQGAPEAMRRIAVGAAVALALLVAAYSVRQVLRGRWVHVDASVPAERRSLHRVLLLLMGGAALGLWLSGQPRAVVAGPALGAAIVGAAVLLERRLKVSLHVSFALLAAALVWPHRGGFAVLLLALGVAWSRLVLRRHTRAEVLLGAAAGLLAGLAFQGLAGGL